MSDEKGPKSPFGKYTEKEIATVEFGTYCVQVGNEVFEYDGKMGFNLKRAEAFYDNILEGLQEMKKSANEIERDDAIKCLLTLRIFPLKIH